MKRQRLDRALVERDLARSRSRAKELIEASRVWVEGMPAEKPATLVEPDSSIEVRDEGPTWVGRGARKIWPFLESGELSVEGHVCLDVGASTGGFTQALLRAGARRVHAVDVGYGQLAYSLRNDDRVEVHERYNFRHASADDFSPSPSRLTMDVSFISSRKLLPALNDVMRSDAAGLFLLKPQFEAGPDENEGGVVRDPAVVQRVVLEVARAWSEAGWGTIDVRPAPLTGEAGNQEFVLTMVRAEKRLPDEETVRAIVQEAMV